MQLEGQGIKVIGLYVAVIDTPMALYDVPKISPASVAAQAYDGVAAGALEVLADDWTRDTKSRMGTRAEEFYPPAHEQLQVLFA